MKSSYASKLCIRVHMLAMLHSAIDEGEHEKNFFLPLFGNTENPLVTACTLRIDYPQ